jgi:enamine deaminase RidA (YjgF/YER057c/UK114 family)
VTPERRRVEAKRPWAKVMGYSRAVRVGNTIEVAGTAASAEDGTIVAPGDPEGQARSILVTIGNALHELGGDYADVVRTRVYLKDAGDWEAVARAHGEVFRDVRPANTTLGARLVDPEMLVEIEVTAVLDDV